MNSALPSLTRPGALLAINLLFLMIWGFAGIGKLIDGIPPWFGDKFGKTFLQTFPGLTATFWILAVSELCAFGLGLVAIARLEFLRLKPPTVLPAMLVWSLFVFLQLGFGLWLTKDFNGAFQHFVYFSGTLLALHFVGSLPAPVAPES